MKSLIGVVAGLVLPTLVFAKDIPNRERVLEAKMVVGHVTGFYRTENLQVSIRTTDGNFLDLVTDGKECFLALNKDKAVTIHYDVVEPATSDHEQSSSESIIRTVKTQGLDFNSWKKAVSKRELESCNTLIQSSIETYKVHGDSETCSLE